MISVYIHIPFCITRCNYCDFCSTTETGLIDLFKQALIAEVKSTHAGDYLSNQQIDTVFFGGGTPSLIEPEYVRTVISQLQDRSSLSENCEITLESNPDDLTPHVLDGYMDAGINRLSIGVQSFIDSELRFINRRHNAQRAIEAANAARSLGTSFSLDLIYGIPNQTMESWIATVERAISLDPDHISTYCLTLEGDTPLQKIVEHGEISELDDSRLWEMYRHTIDALTGVGYEQYEVSSFSKPARRCRHNMAYWTGTPYVGLGPSAASYVHPRRWKNISAIREYCDRAIAGVSAAEESENIPVDTERNEFVMLSLRLADGLDLGEYQKRFGRDLLCTHGEMIERLQADGYAIVVKNGRRLRLTPEGMFQSDGVIAGLI